MQPRRLTTGDLGNTTNAWGSAATEAAAGMLPRRPNLLSAGAGSVPGLLVADSPELTGRDWGLCTQPNSPGSMSSTLGGWNSRPTTGVGVSRIGTAAGGAAERGLSPSVQQQPGSGSSPMHLPRIRTPDSASRDAQRSSSGGGGGGLPPQGSVQAPSSAASGRQPGIRKGVSMARVAFLEPDGLPRDKS